MKRDEILKVAKLAGIALSEDEIERFADLEAIMKLIGQLDQVETQILDSIQPSFKRYQVLRDDVAIKTAALKNHLYTVPEIFDEIE